MELTLVSALQKVFSDDASAPRETDGLCLFKNERGSLQLCVRTDADAGLQVTVGTDLACNLFTVNEVYVSMPMYPHAKNCTLLRDTPGDYPDLLTPFDGVLQTKKGRFACVWAELDAAGAAPGKHTVTFRVSDGRQTLQKAADVWVGSVSPAPQKLLFTDWFHSDCLSQYYNVPVMSDDYWRIVENFMENAARYGMTCILTPLFTPPLDTKVGTERPTVQLVDVTKKGYTYTFDFTLLDKWMTLAEKHGIRHFEFSHLFTQWGALHAPKIMAHTSTGYRRIFGWETDSVSRGYLSFLRQLGAALTDFCDKRGVTNRCLVHCSDEPGDEHIPRYRKCAAAVHEYFGAFGHLDALSHTEFYTEGLVPLPVPSVGCIDNFYGLVPELWCYYCCGQFDDELPNRFIAMPSIKTRILGVLLYKYDCVGFLHWGYNFYNTQLSVARIDPFKETASGGAFPAGDAFTVYPGRDGVPWPSLRQLVFFDGLQDLNALRAAEQMHGRDAVLRLIKDTLGEIDMHRYPMDEETFFAFRKALWELCEC